MKIDYKKIDYKRRLIMIKTKRRLIKSKTIFSILVASLLLIFLVGCGGGGGGDDSVTNTNPTSTIPTDNPTDNPTDDSTNSPPVAVAASIPQFLSGADTPVQLDGSGSFDPDDDPITYEWVITEKPDGSLASLSDPAAVNPTFKADVLGTYVIELTVSDGLDSDIAEVVITPEGENVKPVADAGGNQVVTVRDYVELDGSGSYDANGDDLTYSWNITSGPKDSLTELFGSDTVNPSLIPDTEGSYDISLVVNDGLLDSDPDNIEILAIDADHIDDFIIALKMAVFAINDLDDGDFKNPNMRNALTSKILVVIKNYLKDGYSDTMLDKLTGDISVKMDGCASGGAPDTDDWIINCEAQTNVYPNILVAIVIFESMSS